jgi:hypothetical protein
MPTLTVVTGTRRISASSGGWVRPVEINGKWVINFGYGGSRTNGSVITFWQRPRGKTAPVEVVVIEVFPSDEAFAGLADADPNMEYDAGCASGAAFVAGDTPVVSLGY